MRCNKGLLNRISARMDSPVHWILLLLIALELFALGGANSPLVTLEELRSLNASCGGLDTCRCRVKGDDSMHLFSCQCGPYCVRYGTCCMDAPAILRGEVMQGYMEGLDCSVLKFGDSYNIENQFGKPVLIKNNCPKDWDGDDSVRDLCNADALEKSDLRLLVPVSSLKTGITYRNYFCYVCNTVDELNDSFISWNIKVVIPNVKESPVKDLSTLTYDPKREAWTFPGAPEHLKLYLQPEPPAKLLENFSIFCRDEDSNGDNLNVVSSCPEDWTDDVTRAKCGYYTALVSMGSSNIPMTNYRNVHCGICNGAYLPMVKCLFPRHIHLGPSKFSANVFREIFRISEMPEYRCPEGNIYDKVTKKCRYFGCGSKMKLVSGRCVRN